MEIKNTVIFGSAEVTVWNGGAEPLKTFNDAELTSIGQMLLAVNQYLAAQNLGKIQLLKFNVDGKIQIGNDFRRLISEPDLPYSQFLQLLIDILDANMVPIELNLV